MHCGAPIASRPASDPLIGRTIGNYRIVEAIGEGAMGKVYRAEQTSLKRPVCIKTVLPHFAGDPALVSRFQREAKAASALHHPNIVSVLDFGRTETGLLYLAMELVEGRNLRAVLEKDSPVALQRTLAIMQQLLSALEEAHGLGVVHRDLKPENVLLTKLRDGSDSIKVVDFGIAQVRNQELAEARLTGTGVVCGTPGYMPPEQIMGEELDARADIYAAGVILFELLTGKPPFRANSVQELLQLHLTAIPPSPSQLAPFMLSPKLDAVGMRALERDAAKRFKSALEFKRELELARSGDKSSAAAPSAWGSRAPRPVPGVGIARQPPESSAATVGRPFNLLPPRFRLAEIPKFEIRRAPTVSWSTPRTWATF